MHEAQRVCGRAREGGSERGSASGAVALALWREKNSRSDSVPAGIHAINYMQIKGAPLALTT